MYKKLLTLLLVSFLVQMICIPPVSAVMQTDKETQRIAKMKERIGLVHLEQKRVVITRRGGTKLNGRISEVNESSFIITDEKTGATSEVKYDDAVQVKTKGNFSTGTKVLIGVGIAVAAVVLLVAIKPLGKSPFPKCNADQSNAPCDNSR